MQLFHDQRRKRGIIAELTRVLDAEKLAEARARTIDAALDCPHGAAANLGGFLVRESFGADEQQRLALIGRELGQGDAEVREIEMTILLGWNCKRALMYLVGIIHLAAQLAVLREVDVAQDSEKPGAEVRAGRETSPCCSMP